MKRIINFSIRNNFNLECENGRNLMDNEIRFINNSWRYIRRTVNFNNFTITYEKVEGFSSKPEADR